MSRRQKTIGRVVLPINRPRAMMKSPNSCLVGQTSTGSMSSKEFDSFHAKFNYQLPFSINGYVWHEWGKHRCSVMAGAMLYKLPRGLCAQHQRLIMIKIAQAEWEERYVQLWFYTAKLFAVCSNSMPPMTFFAESDAVVTRFTLFRINALRNEQKLNGIVLFDVADQLTSMYWSKSLLKGYQNISITVCAHPWVPRKTLSSMFLCGMLSHWRNFKLVHQIPMRHKTKKRRKSDV